MRLPKPFGGEPTLDATIHLDGATVVYVGSISRLSVDTLLILSIVHPVKAIEMTSQGGASLHAVRLANAIIDNSIQVTLKEMCMSACANYILPAGKPTVIKPKTILGGMVVPHSCLAPISWTVGDTAPGAMLTTKNISENTWPLFIDVSVQTHVLCLADIYQVRLIAGLVCQKKK